MRRSLAHRRLKHRWSLRANDDRCRHRERLVTAFERGDVQSASFLPKPGVFLIALLDRLLIAGRVCFRVGEKEVYAGKGQGPETVFQVHNPRFFARVLRYGNLGLGEAFIDGDITIEAGELYQFFTNCLRSGIDEHVSSDPRYLARLLYYRVRAFLEGTAKSVRRHYDIGEDIFESFLDNTLTYSCGYAVSTSDSLEDLQRNKLHRICQKLQLGRDHHFLDIGCGFGGLLIFASREYAARGTGVTLSLVHAEGARKRVLEAGLSDRIKIEVGDFRHVTGLYDRIVSVGMMEHVPRSRYGAFFRTIAHHLTTRGLGLIHVVGCNGRRNRHDAFIQKYIFPNSNQPRLSEIAAGLERNGLAILDVENIAQHYAYTALHWLPRFRSNWSRLTIRYDEPYLRMWEYFFHCAVAAASASDSAVYQTLFANDRGARPPLSRV